MNVDMKQRLVAALRSGQYTQGAGTLHRGDTYCCLGVFCDLAAQDGNGEWEPWGAQERSSKNARFYFGMDYSDDLPQPEMLAAYGMAPEDLHVTVSEERVKELDVAPSDITSDSRVHVALLNDKGMPFSEIADLIEAQW